MPDYVHMLAEKPVKAAAVSFMGYHKGKSSAMICEKTLELKYKDRGRGFRCSGYCADRENAKKMQEYIQKQLGEDKAGAQLTIGDF